MQDNQPQVSEFHRVLHGTQHMGIGDHLLRLATVVVGITAVVVIEHPIGALTSAALLMFTLAVVVVEWRVAALECEAYEDDEDQGDEDGDDFGMAA